MLAAAAAWPLYQQYRKSAPQQLLVKAEGLESQGDLDTAQQLYQKLYQEFPESPLAPEGLLRSGRIWQLDKRQEQRALLSYLQLEHDFPEAKQVQTAREEAARIVKYSLRDFSRSIEFYQRLLDSGLGAGDQYLYEIADSYYRLDNYAQARIELETLLDQYPQSRLLPDALYRRGGLQLLENHLEKAREDWQRLIQEFPDSVYTPQARFNLAKLLEEEDRLREALEQYQLLTDYPRPALLEEKIKHLKERIAAKKKAI